jgi:hypothetical protein
MEQDPRPIWVEESKKRRQNSALVNSFLTTKCMESIRIAKVLEWTSGTAEHSCDYSKSENHPNLHNTQWFM